MTEKELLKRIEDLEKRVAALEKGNMPADKAAASDKNRLTVVEFVRNSKETISRNENGDIIFQPDFIRNYEKPIYKRDFIESIKDERIYTRSYGHLIYLMDRIGLWVFILSDNKAYSPRYIGDTLREVKAFAALAGYDVPPKAKTAQLAAEIVGRIGENGYCVCGNQILKSDGNVFEISEFNPANTINNWKQIARGKSFTFGKSVPDIEGKDVKEQVRLMNEFISSATPNPLPSGEERLKLFEEKVK